MSPRRRALAVVLLLAVCLVGAAVPPQGAPAEDATTGKARGSPEYACAGHACGCSPELHTSCCCTKSSGDRAPTTPVYSPCGGGGPSAVVSVSTIVAMLPHGLSPEPEPRTFARISPPGLPSIAPSLEQETPPPRRAVVGA